VRSCLAWQPAYVGLGSNLGDPLAHIERALAALAQLADSRLVVASPRYASPPFGPVEQPPFVNAVAGMLTRLEPLQMLEALQDIQRALGRSASALRWGPREIDLDLLVHGHARLDGPALTLPHPGLAQRDFVLFPLRDIAPQLDVPGLGAVATLAAAVADRGTRRLA
jgi:2-amino-4-hydroxy-6-hydroxymethyldihydropteridine diphosphokinase